MISDCLIYKRVLNQYYPTQVAKLKMKDYPMIIDE